MKIFYSSENLNKFIKIFNSLSDKIIISFIKAINETKEGIDIEYDKFIENIKEKKEMNDLFLFFSTNEKNEGMIIFKYLKFRISLVEANLKKYIYSNIDSKNDTFIQGIISNNIIYLPENIRMEHFNNLLLRISDNNRAAYEKRIKIDRYRALNFYEKYDDSLDKIPDIELNETIFGQVFQNYKDVKGNNFILKKGDKLFSVELKGEHAIDMGGPYHEIISSICNELQSDYVDLFIKSPNNKNNLGQLRDKYIINPNANKNIHNKAYEFIGKLMAMSIFTGEALNLNLHPIVWKNILEKKVDFEEYETIDLIFFNFINELDKGLKNKDHTLINSLDLNFIIKNSNESNIELIENGKENKVNFDNLKNYIKLAKSKRINEFETQIKYIKKGLYSAVDKIVLQILDLEQLEEMVCGKNKLDVIDFKNHTEYYGYKNDDKEIIWFWEWLQNTKEENQFKYLKFVSGRTRLPKSGFGFEYRHIISKINQQNSLPSSSTCFFTLKLPIYSSKNILIEKMEYAIENCIDINDH